MTPRSRRSRATRHGINSDLELRPLMNVFIVLIPMLLMSAVFVEIRVIEMSMPQAAEAAVPVTDQPFEPSVRILADVYLVEVNGTAVQTVARQAPEADGTIPAREAAAQLTQVLTSIAASHPDHKEIRIVAQANTHYQEIIGLMDVARAAGLPQAALEGGS
ncbi:MAG: ExbD/TolR family protein [Gaiellaceae bacterium]